MKIAVLGSGAMGSIFGGRLSQKNDVYMIDVNKDLVNKINREGLKILENGQENIYRPQAVVNPEEIGPIDLLIVFVKATYSKSALDSVRGIIHRDTYLLTLQNGGGHENLLSNYADKDRIIIGTTEDNGKVLDLACVQRGGTGVVNLGMPFCKNTVVINAIKDLFDSAGFTTKISNDIQRIVWDKLAINDTLSVVTGLLQCNMGFISKNQNAKMLVELLAEEFVQIASKIGIVFDKGLILEKVWEISANSKDGVTSICADIMAGRKTEVDTISGYVLSVAEQHSCYAPCHKLVVNAIHALENK